LSALEIPLFVPTSAGRVFGIVSLPDDGSPLIGPGVVLLPGGRAGAGVLPLFQSIARRLAEHGQPAFRFDYPGSGLSAGETAVPRSQLRALVQELCDWFVGETGVEELAVAGRCGGARLALAMPRVDARVRVCVGAVPFFDLGGWSLRSKLAELDAKGPRLARRLIQAPRADRPQEGSRDRKALEAELVEDLRTAAAAATTALIFGEHDVLRTRFHDLISAHGLQDVEQQIEIVVLPEARLHGLPNVDHERSLGAEIEARLRSPAVQRG